MYAHIPPVLFDVWDTNVLLLGVKGLAMRGPSEESCRETNGVSGDKGLATNGASVASW